MKKIKFSDINKRHLTLLGLIVVIAVAGVVNLRMSGDAVETIATVDEVKTAGTDKAKDDAVSQKQEEEKKEDDVYNNAILERDSKRSQSMDVYRDIVNNSNCDRETKENAQEMLTKSAQYINDENVIETLVKAKGIKRCVAYIDKDGVNIVVYGVKLNDKQANQIKDIVTSNTDFTADKIKITENK